MTKRFWLLLSVMIAVSASRDAEAKGLEGINLDLSAGVGQATIQNPDESKANYDLLSIEAKTYLPLFDDPNRDNQFSGGFTLGYRYMDLKNPAKLDGASEVAKMQGIGLGVSMRLFKFYFGFDYHLMKANHYISGATASDLSYTLPLTRYYGGVLFPFDRVGIGVAYVASSAQIPAGETGLSKASPFSEQSLMLTLVYGTGESFIEFLGYLF